MLPPKKHTVPSVAISIVIETLAYEYILFILENSNAIGITMSNRRCVSSGKTLWRRHFSVMWLAIQRHNINVETTYVTDVDKTSEKWRRINVDILYIDLIRFPFSFSPFFLFSFPPFLFLFSPYSYFHFPHFPIFHFPVSLFPFPLLPFHLFPSYFFPFSPFSFYPFFFYPFCLFFFHLS